jgi:hypothetical protein
MEDVPCPTGQWISEERTGQSALSTRELCANAGALIMPAAGTPMTSDVCASFAIRLLERIILFLIVLELPRH